MSRYLCIHGHFYQPPRENPWLEEIEQQDSAYPYHDWNERVSAECYAPNAAAQLLDSEQRIVQIVNNYESISFNFGATLLSWMEHHDRGTYQAILEADVSSQKRFGGHGSAIAQVYNHMILPLASPRDRRTQVRWGIVDFQHRFRRMPEGMWLAETAVDLASLEALAAEGIQFTILAPRQCKAVRKRGEKTWMDVSGGRVDPSHPYFIKLPSGNIIAVFFYDGPISQAVAFEGLLHRGENFAHRLIQAFSDRRQGAQLAHIATDGETYGHHHRGGEMALAHALKYIEEKKLAELTNYGQFLEKFPPEYEAKIAELSSWSCVHGVERWRSDCGCRTGGQPGWSQAWRGPLRDALDWLRDELARRYEDRAARLLRDPWAVRDDYIDVILERIPGNVEAFLVRHAIRPLQPLESQTCLKLLEMQRCTLLMYTSCGWFFDELSGLEPVQVLQYASRAVQLCEEIFGDDLEPELLRRLEKARSNLEEHRDGRNIYEKMVRPAKVTLGKVAAHYAMTSLFEKYTETSQVYSYKVHRNAQRHFEAGSARIVIGEVDVSAIITGERSSFSYGVIHVGDHNPRCGVSEQIGNHEALSTEMVQYAQTVDLPAIFRLLDRTFGSLSYSIQALFRDEQRRLLSMLLGPIVSQTERSFLDSYERNRTLLRFLAEMKLPLPVSFQALATVALNAQLRKEFSSTVVDSTRIRTLLIESKSLQITMDVPALEQAARDALNRQVARLKQTPEELSELEQMEMLTKVVKSLPFPVSLREAQNVIHDLSEHHLQSQRRGPKNALAVAWIRGFEALGEALGIRI